MHLSLRRYATATKYTSNMAGGNCTVVEKVTRHPMHAPDDFEEFMKVIRYTRSHLLRDPGPARRVTKTSRLQKTSLTLISPYTIIIIFV